MENLEIVRNNIKHTVEELDKLVRLLNNPANMILTKDRSWGKYTINMNLRLDEISIDEFEKFLPQFKIMLAKYKELRKQEAEITNQADIQRAINPMMPYQ